MQPSEIIQTILPVLQEALGASSVMTEARGSMPNAANFNPDSAFYEPIVEIPEVNNTPAPSAGYDFGSPQ